MKTYSLKAVALRTSFLAIAATAGHAFAALPVIDGTNLSQNTVTALENVVHTLKQIQQYKTQLEQYQNMLQNTAAPPSYIWDMASNTIRDLRSSIDTLRYYKSTLGSVDGYLEKFKDTNSYRNSPCFTTRGCTASEWASMRDAQDWGSQSQKYTNDATLRTIDRQQEALEADARQLERIQRSAQSANGQMQAIGYANQLASQQANQLLQMRAILTMQLNLIATRNQALADKEALQAAAAAQFYKSTYRPSPLRSW